jgi:two-component system nitrate/nitrite response regulator NarL
MVDVINVLVADDHALLRGALCEALQTESDVNVVAEAGCGRVAVELASSLCPQVAILDVEMPGQDLATTLRQLRDRCPDTAVLVLTMHDDPDRAAAALALGASGYLHKSTTRGMLVSAIQMAGRPGAGTVTTLLPRRGRTAEPGRERPAGPPLSAREIEVLRQVARARSNRQIATGLGITEGTVKRHLRNIFGKLGAVSRLDAVNKAVAAALIDPSPGRHRAAQ